MKTTLYNKPDFNCIYTSQDDFSIHNGHGWKRINFPGVAQVANFSLELTGKKWRIMWPNREGELFALSRVSDVIKKYNSPGGLTLSYPATASCRTIILLEDTDKGIAVLAPPEREGRVTEFRINSNREDRATLSVSGNRDNWYVLNFNTLSELHSSITNLTDSVPWKQLPAGVTKSAWQVQVGLIGTDGKTAVPLERGFDILPDISLLMGRLLGKGNILHVFAYAEGHDLGYPDYSPSQVLGGDEKLQKAVEKVHLNKQKIVFYLNGRIAQREKVLNTSLFDSVLTDFSGKPVEEVYQGRTFYVMNPSSREWQERIIREALHLQSLGVDGVQLDQLGGRAAVVPPGEIWGKGYLDLIKALKEEGLSVWIQGVSDIYPADWFELTYRNVSVLKDGTIRGGTPFGTADRRLFELIVPGQILLVPLSRINTFSKDEEKIIVDLDKKGGELFLYNSSYMAQLEDIILKAVHKKG